MGSSINSNLLRWNQWMIPSSCMLQLACAASQGLRTSWMDLYRKHHATLDTIWKMLLQCPLLPLNSKWSKGKTSSAYLPNLAVPWVPFRHSDSLQGFPSAGSRKWLKGDCRIARWFALCRYYSQTWQPNANEVPNVAPMMLAAQKKKYIRAISSQNSLQHQHFQ